MEKALYSHLINTAAISTVVGARVYPAGEVPQNTAWPYLTYQRIDTEPLDRRFVGTQSRKRRSIFQVDAWGRGPSQLSSVLGLASAIWQANGGVTGGPMLHGFTGTMASGGSAVVVKSCWLRDQRHDDEAAGLGGEEAAHRASLDFAIEYVEP